MESVCELLGLPVDTTDGWVRGAQLLDALGGFGFWTARGRGQGQRERVCKRRDCRRCRTPPRRGADSRCAPMRQPPLLWITKNPRSAGELLGPGGAQLVGRTWLREMHPVTDSWREENGHLHINVHCWDSFM